jgi:shikimate kinase
MNTIFLIGFMGAGKTTIGKELAARLGMPVYDTDEEIVKETGKSIAQIFDNVGEDGFRSIETNTLKRIPTKGTVITTGGGIILREKNREWLKNSGTVIFLDVNPEEVIRRLKDDHSRPLIKANKEKNIHELMLARIPLYTETSHFQIQTSGKQINQIIVEIETCLGK